MSERETDRKALTPYATSYPAQVQAAGRQLAIAAQLNQDLDRRRFVAILKRIATEEAAFFLSSRQALEGDLIERFVDDWNWWDLSNNEALPWSLELIERFEDRWDWEGLFNNGTLPWSLELIERFEDRGLFNNETRNWCRQDEEEEQEQPDRWDWEGLFNNETLPWSLGLIERFEDRWDWRGFSSNEALPWSLELIERFEELECGRRRGALREYSLALVA